MLSKTFSYAFFDVNCAHTISIKILAIEFVLQVSDTHTKFFLDIEVGSRMPYCSFSVKKNWLVLVDLFRKSGAINLSKSITSVKNFSKIFSILDAC